MAGFGGQLRTERERLGVTLARLCAETKVQERHLSALEEENYAALPGGVFRKGIVRAYLKATGLAEDEWMPRFQQSFAEQANAGRVAIEDGQADWAAFAQNVRKNRAGARQSRPLRWVGVLFLLSLLLAAGWAVWHFLLRRGSE